MLIIPSLFGHVAIALFCIYKCQQIGHDHKIMIKYCSYDVKKGISSAIYSTVSKLKKMAPHKLELSD